MCISQALIPPAAGGVRAFFFEQKILGRQAMRIQIYDTTLRDGTQSESVAFSVEDKL